LIAGHEDMNVIIERQVIQPQRSALTFAENGFFVAFNRGIHAENASSGGGKRLIRNLLTVRRQCGPAVDYFSSVTFIFSRKTSAPHPVWHRNAGRRNRLSIGWPKCKHYLTVCHERLTALAATK
jgi:hypothetical protein